MADDPPDRDPDRSRDQPTGPGAPHHGVDPGEIEPRVAVWGAAITVSGFAGSLGLALPLLAVAGFGDFISATFRSTIWNQTISDELRGRRAGIEPANVASGPLLGNLEAGAVARLRGTQFSIVSGGIACLVGAAVLAWRMPEFVRYRSQYGGET